MSGQKYVVCNFHNFSKRYKKREVVAVIMRQRFKAVLGICAVGKQGLIAEKLDAVVN